MRGWTVEREKKKGEEGEKPDDVMRFIVKEGAKVGRANTQTSHFFFFPPLLSFFSVGAKCRDAERQLRYRPRISADVANWPYLASQERKKKKRKEGGSEGQNSTSGFYQTDVESAAAAAFQAPKLNNNIWRL